MNCGWTDGHWEGNSSGALPGALDEGNECCVFMDAPVQTRLDPGDHDSLCRTTEQAHANYEALHTLLPGTVTEYQIARSSAGIQWWSAADRDAGLVEGVDLHGCTVCAQAEDLTQEQLDDVTDALARVQV
jgi:hypothetical protein